jgi:hypothetical protein
MPKAQPLFAVLQDIVDKNIFYCENHDTVQFDPQNGKQLFNIIYKTDDEQVAKIVVDDQREMNGGIVEEVDTTEDVTSMID